MAKPEPATTPDGYETVMVTAKALSLSCDEVTRLYHDGALKGFTDTGGTVFIKPLFDEQVFTSKQIAALLFLRLETVEDLLKRSHFASVMIGEHARITAQEALRFCYAMLKEPIPPILQRLYAKHEPEPEPEKPKSAWDRMPKSKGPKVIHRV